jgi:hypothetical protein
MLISKIPDSQFVYSLKRSRSIIQMLVIMKSAVIEDWKSNWIEIINWIKTTIILNAVATGDIFGPVASTDFSSVICSRLCAFLNERFKKI